MFHTILQENKITRIILPQVQLDIILAHCNRKLAQQFLPEETPGKKAFGLVGGVIDGSAWTIGHCIPLLRNSRKQAPFKDYMDRIIAEHAVPSITPLEQRGWVADRQELLARSRELREMNLQLLGSYHMHWVSWQHDRQRDTPTTLDLMIGRGSGLCQFIISMVDPKKPSIRAFFEGDDRREIPLCQIP